MTNLEDLEKLHDLKEKGVISEADFEAKKLAMQKVSWLIVY